MTELKNLLKKNKWFVVLLILILLHLLIPVTIFLYYNLTGWPTPKYITHNPLAFTRIGDVMAYATYTSLIITPIILFISGVILAVRHHALVILGWVVGLVFVNLIFSFGDLALLIASVA